MRPRYEHRQGGGFTRISFIVALLALPLLYRLDPKSGPALVIGLPILLLLFAAFDGLTIRIDRDELVWRFGHLGFPRGRVRIADIERVGVTRTTFWEGWGIRWTRRGWLYNVSGFDAVQIERRGGRPFLLGTDEPRRLQAALTAAMTRSGAGRQG